MFLYQFSSPIILNAHYTSIHTCLFISIYIKKRDLKNTWTSKFSVNFFRNPAWKTKGCLKKHGTFYGEIPEDDSVQRAWSLLRLVEWTCPVCECYPAHTPACWFWPVILVSLFLPNEYYSLPSPSLPHPLKVCPLSFYSILFFFLFLPIHLFCSNGLAMESIFLDLSFSLSLSKLSWFLHIIFHILLFLYLTMIENSLHNSIMH